MIEKLERSSGALLGFKMSGKLHDNDYQKFVRLVENTLQSHKRVRLLAHFDDFHGWDLHALWDDIKFSTKHCMDIEDIVLVGEKEWEEWMAKVCKPFTTANVEYFHSSEVEAAWQWLERRP
jgi:SpoIIAA-like